MVQKFLTLINTNPQILNTNFTKNNISSIEYVLIWTIFDATIKLHQLPVWIILFTRLSVNINQKWIETLNLI